MQRKPQLKQARSRDPEEAAGDTAGTGGSAGAAQHSQSVRLQELQSGATELGFLFGLTKESFSLTDD